jgi:transcriptional regulator with XRE-family HTH domain
MLQIHAKQIKAARAYLDWSQEDLARASGLAVSTIRNLETGYIPRGKTTKIIRQAIENAGLEFIEPEGFRRRTDEVNILEGLDSCDALFEDMIATVKKRAYNISIMMSQEMLFQFFGLTGAEHQSNLARLKNYADILCLLSDAEKSSLHMPQIEFRTTAKENIGPMPYFLYDNKHVLVLREGGERFRFVVFNSPLIAFSYRAHFLSIWELATPLTSIAEKRRVIA